MLAERGAVEPEVNGGLQTDGLRADLEERFVQYVLEAVERAAQARAAFTVVALRPEQGCQGVATLELAAHGQVDHQRQRLAQIQRDRLTIVFQARRAEHIQLDVRHGVLSQYPPIERHAGQLYTCRAGHGGVRKDGQHRPLIPHMSIPKFEQTTNISTKRSLPTDEM